MTKRAYISNAEIAEIILTILHKIKSPADSSVKIIVDQTFNRDIFLRMFISRPPRRERSRTQAAEIPLSVQQRGRFLPRPVFL